MPPPPNESKPAHIISCPLAPPTLDAERHLILLDLAKHENDRTYKRAFILLQQAEDAATKPMASERRPALDHAYNALLLVQGKDPALSARILDAYLMTCLGYARTDPAYFTSRQSLLKTAFTIYQEAGQSNREIAVLTRLRTEAADQNTRDWANVQLAPLLIGAGQDKQAASALKAIRDPQMQASQNSLPALEAKIKKEKPNPPAIQTPIRPGDSHADLPHTP